MHCLLIMNKSQNKNVFLTFLQPKNGSVSPFGPLYQQKWHFSPPFHISLKKGTPFGPSFPVGSTSPWGWSVLVNCEADFYLIKRFLKVYTGYVKWCEIIIWLTVCIHRDSAVSPEDQHWLSKFSRYLRFYTFIIAWFAINLKAMLEVLTLGVRPEKYFLLSAGDYIMFVCEMYVWVGGNIVILRVKILFKILVRKGVYIYRPLATFITVLLVLYYFGCLYYFITYTRVAINSLFFSYSCLDPQQSIVYSYAGTCTALNYYCISMLFGCNILILLVLTTDNSVCQILSFSKVFDKKKFLLSDMT